MTRIQSRPWLAWALVALFALALTAAPLWAASQGVSTDSATKALKYAACALALAASITPLGLMAATAMCLSVFFAEVD